MEPDQKVLRLLPPRFWEKVNQDGPAVLDSPCWVWTAWTTGGRRPYGMTRDGQRRILAHRWAWQIVNGEIPAGHQVDHLCRTTLCVRPSHLEAVTPRENFLRSTGAGAVAVREGRCSRGHEFTNDNTYVYPSGQRRKCRACARLLQREYVRRQKARRAS